MSTPPDESDRELALHEILLALVEAIEQGQGPDLGQFLAEHPQFAAEIAEFWASRDRVERLAAPFRAAHAEMSWEDNSGAGPDASAISATDAFPSPPSRSRGKRQRSALAAPIDGHLGDFRLLREVGRGGMGIVYEAEQISLNRRVALKVLRFVAAFDPKQLQRFKNEAQTAALLHHPHIVSVHSVGCERGVHYYAMQFIDGQSLAALIQELRPATGKPPWHAPNSPGLTRTESPTAERCEPAAGPVILLDRSDNIRPVETGFSPVPQTSWPGESGSAATAAGTGGPAAATVFAPAAAITTERTSRRAAFFRRAAHLGKAAAEALEHAHQLGVVHRDIKPANLLLDVRGNLWIADFGLALLASDTGLTTTGELVGTLRYMSPEQAGGQRGLVDHRTDIYSLGATLYELLTLEPLFESQDRHQLFRQIASDEPRPPRSIDRAIPVELETIVLKALAKNPSDRYATAQELGDDLKRFLEDQPVRARRPTLLDRATKWSRRHRPVVISALVLLVTVTVGLLASTVLIARAHREATAAWRGERQKTKEALQQKARAEANFLQARRAVDFFVQVSEEELVDRPDILEVRRKLLEGALEYYQEFIDQHRDDHSLQTELAASSARVAQVLDELSAQQDYLQFMLLGMLLTENGVQDDLAVTPPQKAKITELSSQLAKERREAFGTIRKLPREEQWKRYKATATANEQAIAGILTPQQSERLGQIALQKRGLQAFDEPEVESALQLTREQQAAIRTISDDVRHAVWNTHGRHRRREEGRQHAEEAWQQAEEKVMAVLSVRQQAAWKKLIGQPFRGKIPWLELGPGPARPSRGERGARNAGG